MNKAVLRRSLRIYTFLLQYYPKHYRQEFGKEMQFVFSESLKEAYAENGQPGVLQLWIRTLLDTGKGLLMAHRETTRGGETMKTKRNDLLMQNKIFLWILVAVGLLLLIPLIGQWPWTMHDFIFAFVLLFGAGFSFVMVARKARTAAYRAAVGVGVATTLILLWVNAAVGIIGDGPVNDLYAFVLLVGIVGALVARFKPRGMSLTLFAMAITQMAIPVYAFFAFHPPFDPGVIGVFTLNAVFAALFIGSGLLFLRAADMKRN